MITPSVAAELASHLAGLGLNSTLEALMAEIISPRRAACAPGSSYGARAYRMFEEGMDWPSIAASLNYTRDISRCAKRHAELAGKPWPPVADGLLF